MSEHANGEPHAIGRTWKTPARHRLAQPSVGRAAIANRSAAPIDFVVLDAEIVPWRVVACDQPPARSHPARTTISGERIVHSLVYRSGLCDTIVKDVFNRMA